MIAANLVINSISSMLHRPDPRRKASYSLARILSQLDVRDLPYDEGVSPNRRNDTTRHVSIGIWLIPVQPHQQPSATDTSLAQPAVTCDLRRQGIGVLVPSQSTATRFLVAVADLDEVWRFFLTDVRHQSARPGGWRQLGLDIVRTVELESLQMLRFRNRLNSLSDQTSATPVLHPAAPSTT